MQKWLLAVTAIAIGTGLLIGRASDIAALEQMETHSLGTAGSSVVTSVYSPGLLPVSDNKTLSFPSDFDVQVEAWINSLSAREEFREWQGAAWTRYPLGAGMHGWLVLLHKDGKEVGYLVVGANNDGSLALTEYGAGEHPLFSMNTLYRSLIQVALIPSDPDRSEIDASAPALPFPVERLYYSPLHAVWKIAHGGDTLYIDAKTGEQLPLTASSFESVQPFDPSNAISGTALTVTKSLSLRPFDPFDNTYWITDSAMFAGTSQDVGTALESEGPPITFKANLYGKTVLAPFAVTGYHDWGTGPLYIRLEQDGTKYVPFGVLAEYGSFHRQRDNAHA